MFDWRIYSTLTCMICLLVEGVISQSESCGVERWAIKTLSDQDTVKIDFDNIVASSIQDQINISNDVNKRNRRAASECIVYSLPCAIVGFKLEDDRDIHIIIEDTITEETMVVEIISPDCQEVRMTSRYSQFEILNKWFYDNIGVPENHFLFLKNHIPVIITGLGYFDTCHGQKGMSANCRELHPVLSIFKINNQGN